MRPLAEVEVPARLAKRPRDRRGYPIPWVAMTDAEGRPDFRVTSAERWVIAARQRVCTQCGEPLGRHLAFIGGPLSYESRLFTDLAMHKDCAQYAVQVCPFLAAPSMRYAEEVPQMKGTPTVRHTPEMSSARPDRFFVATTHNYQVVQTGTGAVVVRAGPWEWVQWWRHGGVLLEES